MAQSKQGTLPNTQLAAKLEGGRGEVENPDAASPSSEKPRNSSGSGSAAASQLELRQRVLFLEDAMFRVLTALGDDEAIRGLRAARQQGFRSRAIR